MLKKLLAAAVVAATLTAAHAEVKTIKDVLGREVKVDVPAKRIMLGFYYTDYLSRLAVKKRWITSLASRKPCGRTGRLPAGRCTARRYLN